MMHYSVAIPAYNAARTIGDTLRSVLSQTIPPEKVVVVDDGSTDNTAEIAQSISPLVVVIRQANSGVGSATNKAVKGCNSPVLAMLDADDLWLPQKMEKQLNALKSAPEKTIVISEQRLFHHGSDDFVSGPTRQGAVRSVLVMNRHIFDLIGEIIDPPGGRGEMVDWFARARELGCTFHDVGEPLMLRRIIPGSLSFGRHNEKDRGYLYVAFLAMQRRKALEKPV